MIPVVETARLTLRGRTVADFPAFAAMWADARVTRFIGGAPIAEEDAWAKFARMEGFWRLTGCGFWIVEERATGAVIGELGLADFRRAIDPPLGRIPEFGWAFASTAQGKGYATEALGAALAWGDEKFPGSVFPCIIDEENTPSVRLAEKHGFKRVGPATYKGAAVSIFRRPAPASHSPSVTMRPLRS
ncbi:MAG: GNAT family N-acetyltransferase [Parvularculaceae bacterium]